MHSIISIAFLTLYSRAVISNSNNMSHVMTQLKEYLPDSSPQPELESDDDLLNRVAVKRKQTNNRRRKMKFNKVLSLFFSSHKLLLTFKFLLGYMLLSLCVLLLLPISYAFPWFYHLHNWHISFLIFHPNLWTILKFVLTRGLFAYLASFSLRDISINAHSFRHFYHIFELLQEVHKLTWKFASTHDWWRRHQSWTSPEPSRRPSFDYRNMLG